MMSQVIRTKRVKCLRCGNYMIVNIHNNCESGVCPVCSTLVFSKQKNEKERIIKIRIV